MIPIPLDQINLIEIEKKLSEFKKHHQLLGANNAAQLIKTELIEDKSPRQAEAIEYHRGYDKGIKDCYELIVNLLVFPNSEKAKEHKKKVRRF